MCNIAHIWKISFITLSPQCVYASLCFFFCHLSSFTTIKMDTCIAIYVHQAPEELLDLSARRKQHIEIMAKGKPFKATWRYRYASEINNKIKCSRLKICVRINMYNIKIMRQIVKNVIAKSGARHLK